MNSLRRWLYRPKRSDQSLLAQFYFADEELNHVAAELDSFEGRGDPERCAALVNQLRACQARVLNVVSQMMDESIKDQRALRDFRVKFPDDLCQENLAGQLWFGAECLAAGSSIMNKEVESACMRPLARALTKNLESLRTILREQCLQNVNEYTELITESLIIFDKLFAEFELSYVSAMAPVKTAHEYDMIQEITVLFSETVQRALKIGLLSQDMIDEYDPALMFTIPRLAIISGTLIFKDGPLNPDNQPRNISEMFRPFQTLLHKIRELLSILTPEELNTLERALCSQDEPSFLVSLEENRKQAREERRKHRKRKKSTSRVEKQVETQEDDNGSIESELTAREIAERLEALALNFEASRTNSGVGAHGRDGGNPSGEAQSQTREECTSSTQLSSDIVDNTCPRNLATDLDLSEHEEGQRLCGLKSVDDSHNEASEDISAFEENSVHTVPGFSFQDQEALGSDANVLLSSDAKCESTGVLEDKEMDDDDDDDRSIGKNNGAHPGDFGHYGLNKCDSNDSGLHSEIMSNSGSLFTISSSDSNQQITNSESISNLPDQNGSDCAEDGVSTLRVGLSEIASVNCEEKSVGETDGTQPPQEHNFDDQLNTNNCRSDEKSSEYIDMDEDDAPSPHTNAAVEITPHINGGRSSVSSLENSEYCKSDDLLDNDVMQVECQPESDLDLEPKHDLSDSHACALTISNQGSHVPNHSPDNFPMPNDACDISMVKVKQLDSCAKKCEVLCDNLSNEAPSTYQVEKTDISETDFYSDSQPLSLNEDCLGNQDQLSKGRPSLPRQKPEDSSLSSSNTFPDPSDYGDCPSAAITNGHVDHLYVSSTQDGAMPTSNLATSSTSVPESADITASAPPPSQTSSSSSSSHVQTKHNSKKGHHRGQRESQRTSRSRLSKDKKSKLCAAHSKMLLQASQLDSDCYNSSETSSYTSDCGDQEEIALAIEAAENASRNNVRARFKSNSDMIHRLFVCVSGVADQLQTNFAGDLRNILRSVFDMNCSEAFDKSEGDKPKDSTPLGAAYRAMSHAARASRHRHSSLRRQDPPVWLPDEDCNECLACKVPFTFVRRRHHCRNCGKIYCGRCSSNYVPLPQFGQEKAVRVCNRCFMFQVTPFH